MMDRMLLLLFGFGCLVFTAVGQSPVHVWNYQEYPDPHSYDTYSQCKRYNLSNICDPDGIISRDDADRIDSLIESVRRETRCSCQHCFDYSHGYLIRVAIMPRIEPIRLMKNETHDMEMFLKDAKLYSYLLSERFALSGWCNETVLILYSRYDGLLYTLTRKNAREKLKDDYVKKITLAVRPFFDNRETVGIGLMEMITRYKRVFEGDSEKALLPSTGAQRGSGADGLMPSFTVSFLLSSLLIFLMH